MVKIGLIGCGFMGGMHAACYKALADLGVQVTAIADVRPDRAENLFERSEVESTKRYAHLKRLQDLYAPEA